MIIGDVQAVLVHVILFLLTYTAFVMIFEGIRIQFFTEKEPDERTIHLQESLDKIAEAEKETLKPEYTETRRKRGRPKGSKNKISSKGGVQERSTPIL
jgi:hypothetical protein